MATGMGKSLRIRRSRSAGIMDFSEASASRRQRPGVSVQASASVVDEVGIFLPMGLHQDAVDVVDVDSSVLGADGFDQATHREVSGLAEDAVGGADDEVEGG